MLAHPRTHSAEEDAGMGAREDGLEAHTIATAFPKILSSLVGNPLSHRYGADPPGLKTTTLGIGAN